MGVIRTQWSLSTFWSRLVTVLQKNLSLSEMFRKETVLQTEFHCRNPGRLFGKLPIHKNNDIIPYPHRIELTIHSDISINPTKLSFMKPNEQQGQTALSIAQKLGYISVIETLKVVTETTVTTTTTVVTEEKYKVVAPETMHETFMSDSEDEGDQDNMMGDHSFKYLTGK